MQPNALNFKSNEHPASKELREVKSLLKQAMQEIGVKNQIIEKFTDFKERIEQMKNEEIVNLKSMFEQVRKKDEEAYSDHIRDLNDQIEEEKRTNDELMDMMGNKLNEDSMIDASHEELGDFKQQIFHKDQIINDVQSKNVELSKKLDMIWEEKSMLEEKFDSFELLKQSIDYDANTNMVLSQKIQYMETELNTLAQIKDSKDKDLNQAINELNQKDKMIIDKNNKIQELHEQLAQNENDYKEHLEQILNENDDLKGNCYEFQQDVEEYKNRLENLQSEIEDVHSKSTQKESEIMTNMQNEQDRAAKYLELQKVLNSVQTENELLKNQISELQNALEDQEDDMLDITNKNVSQSNDDTERIDELETQLKSTIKNHQLKEEVSNIH